MKDYNLIPFNAWSRERICCGKKSATSRHKKYLHDPLVYKIEKHPWGVIRDGYFKEEGADTPQELQAVIEDIYNRKVLDDEVFYIHFFDNLQMHKRLVGISDQEVKYG